MAGRIARLLRPAGNTSTPTSTGMTMGTPLYMAPEQIEGKRVDGRSDVYALGAVLYELVTGRPPFEGEDALSIAFKHVHEAPLPPRWINGAVPEDWEALILKALAKDPVDRFQTAVAMERAIAGLSERDRSGVVPAGPPLEKPDGGAVVVSARAGRVEPAPDRTTGRERSPRFGRRALSGVAGLLVAAVVAYLVLGRVTAPAAGSTAGQFDGPTGLTLDLRGDVYVVDQGNDRVQEFSPGGAPLERWGTKGKGTLQFDAPSDVAISPNGDLYVSDGANKRIQVLRSGRQIDEIDFNGGSIAVDTHGNLYATDYFDSVIRKYPYPVDRDVWTALAVPEITVGRFPYPAGVTVDAKGIIYVADREHDRFVELSAAGKLLFAMGNSGKAPDQFNRPSDVALDRKGDIYVADTRNDRIQKFSPDRLFLTQWGSPGTRIGQFEQPVCIAVDARGNIYVSDHFNNRVQKLSPSGKPIWATDGVSLGRG